MRKYGRAIGQLALHKSAVTALADDPAQGGRLWTGSDRGTIRVWAASWLSGKTVGQLHEQHQLAEFELHPPKGQVHSPSAATSPFASYSRLPCAFPCGDSS